MKGRRGKVVNPGSPPAACPKGAREAASQKGFLEQWKELYRKRGLYYTGGWGGVGGR